MSQNRSKPGLGKHFVAGRCDGAAQRSLRWIVAVVVLWIVSLLGPTASWAQGPTISGISPTSGPVGLPVTISGSGFGSTQGSSTVTLNGTSAAVTSWSDGSVVAVVPSAASSGAFTVTVNSQQANSSTFTVTLLPSGWSDGDVGTVGTAGSASYANNQFTVKGAGSQVWSTADSFNYAYQSLSGDGTIVARVVSLSGGGSTRSAGVMIRETLTAGSRNAYSGYGQSAIFFDERTTTGGSTSSQSLSSVGLPYWVKLVRSGNTFSGYASLNGVTWVQVGTNQTISMATNVYIGLVVNSDNTSTLATTVFDNVSVTNSSATPPLISSVSPSSGIAGTQLTISGSGFGSSQSGSVVYLSNVLATVSSWSDTSITATVPSGATTGPLVISAGPEMDDSNAVVFTVLPTGWLDQDVGTVGVAGSASYSNGVFTVQGAGVTFSGYSAADAFNFAYQPLSGDGTIVARVVSVSSTYAQAGVMIRETLNANATCMFVADYTGGMGTYYRTTTGANLGSAGGPATPLPYWVMLVRSGNGFSGYSSSDGINWVQIGTTETISMATTVYIGLGVTSGSTSTLYSATFDNVSVSSTASPAPVITGVSATTGSIGSQVVISGLNFGASQGNSVVLLNDAAMTVNSWSATSITITISSGATTGDLVVSVAPSMDESNPVRFAVTSTPLPPGWLDQDVGHVGVAGSANYSNGVFTLQGAGVTFSGYSAADAFHFAYQPLSGDGTIVARIVSVSSTYAQAGVMIRETMNANATNMFVDEYLG